MFHFYNWLRHDNDYLTFIYSRTYESRTFARLRRVPCLYHSVFAAFTVGIPTQTRRHSPNSILASHCQRDHRPSYENALTTNETTQATTETTAYAIPFRIRFRCLSEVQYTWVSIFLLVLATVLQNPSINPSISLFLFFQLEYPCESFPLPSMPSCGIYFARVFFWCHDSVVKKAYIWSLTQVQSISTEVFLCSHFFIPGCAQHG